MTLNLGILLALACAIATQLGFLYKHRGANEAPAVDIRHPLRTARRCSRRKWFAIGMAVATGAWIFHVAALAFAPLSVVQAVLSTGVVILAVLAERHLRLQGRHAASGSASRMTALGLLLLVITLPAAHGAHSAYSLAGMIAFEARHARDRRAADLAARASARPTTTTASCSAPPPASSSASPTSPSRRSPAPAASLGVAPLARGWPSRSSPRSSPSTPRPAACRTARPSRSSPPPRTAANVSCILGGIIVFGDPMPGDALGIAVQAFAFVLVVVAAAGHPAAGPRGGRQRAPPRA